MYNAHVWTKGRESRENIEEVSIQSVVDAIPRKSSVGLVPMVYNSTSAHTEVSRYYCESTHTSLTDTGDDYMQDCRVLIVMGSENPSMYSESCEDER